MKLFKIAIVIGSFPATSETFIINQVNALLDEGHDVRLFAYNQERLDVKHSSYERHRLLENVTYFQVFPKDKMKRLAYVFKCLITYKNISFITIFKILNVFKYGVLASSFKLFYEMQWFLKTKEFDIIHAHFGHNAKRIAFLKSLGFLENTKLITTFHGYDLVPNHYAFYNEEYKHLITQSDAFTANTLYLKELIKPLQTRRPIYILPVGLDTNHFKREQRKSITLFFNIVYCGRLIPLKGPDIAISILKELHQRGYVQARLHLIGDGDLMPQLKTQISEFQLDNDILLYGKLTQDKVKAILQDADVFILPGIYDPNNHTAETQGLVVQEAQAMGLPVIVSDAGGAKYGLIEGETGFVVKAGDVCAFADAIERFILMPNLKERMGEKGITYVKAKYDNKILVETLLQIYKEVL